MVVRVNRKVVTAAAPEALIRQICDHLVHIHVYRGAAAAVHQIDRELVVVVAARNFPCRIPDRRGDPVVEDSAGCVGLRCRRLDMAESRHQVRPLTHSLARHAEVSQSPHRVRAVEGAGGDRHVAEGVPFGTELYDGALSQLSILVSRAFLVRTHNDTVRS